MCHCLLRNFFLFENAKIWVGRTTLNSEKKGTALLGSRVLKRRGCYFVLSVVVICIMFAKTSNTDCFFFTFWIKVDLARQIFDAWSSGEAS